jgi:hypothetical protein
VRVLLPAGIGLLLLLAAGWFGYRTGRRQGREEAIDAATQRVLDELHLQIAADPTLAPQLLDVLERLDRKR